MDVVLIIYLIFNIIVFAMILIQLYIVANHGKLIIKIGKSRTLSMVWAVLLILWNILLWPNIIGYMQHKRNDYIYMVLTDLLWILLSIYFIIRSFRNSEIREKGIYDKTGNFYRWSKIQSYSWVSPGKIVIKVTTFFKNNRYCEFAIKEEFRPKVNEIVQKYVHS